MSKKHYLSRKQYDDFKKDLEILINVKLPQNSEDIATAVAQGDLSENAEYDNAKEEQAILNQQLAKIKNILANAEIIKQTDRTDFVEIGHKVTLLSLDTNKTEVITLMGYGDGKESISVESPLGTAILGKEKDNEIVVDAPVGELKYKILNIE